VISRALGAEQGVEVDMKTMEVDDGTEFLLCTDGITRHVSDNEIRQLMVISNSLDDLCSELKRRCYDRGAEDNLTVVAVRVGEHLRAEERSADLEPTISPETERVYAMQSGNGSASGDTTFMPASRIAFPAPQSEPAPVTPLPNQPLNVVQSQPPAGSGSAARVFGFALVLLLIAAAFYAGARFKERIPFLASKVQPLPAASPVATAPPEEPFVKFERARRQVDQDPRAWLATEPGKELVAAGVQGPLDSPNAEFLYLYGRANLLTGNTDEATKAFDAAVSKSDLNPSPANATIKKEAILGLSMISVKTQKDRWKVLNHYEELTKPPANSNAP
jgi:hypothetical protein